MEGNGFGGCGGRFLFLGGCALIVWLIVRHPLAMGTLSAAVMVVWLTCVY